ncbi:MAG: phytanoyl-CoA dioxygenase family protein [Bacteroidales bacterium]|nr:phytanoyl-CoA dioxygenase family protein [Bacteroidales bacterium]
MTQLTRPSPWRTQWEREGFVILRGLYDTPEIAAAAHDADRVREEYAHLVNVQNIRCRWQDNVFTGECQFDAFDPIIDLSPVCRGLAHDPRLFELLATLYGEPACLFKDKLIFKMPGAKGYGLHQDWIAWERFPRSFLSVLVPLDPADEDNGCTLVYPGYHQVGPLTPTDGTYRELAAETVDESQAVPLILEPGDVAVFSGFTPHRSNPNLSDRPRRQLYFSYTRQSDGGELRGQHYQDFHQFLKAKYAEYGKHDTYYA